MFQADLHLYSWASQRPSGPFSGSLGLRHSYSDPEELAAQLRLRGMTHITLTDFDTLDGVLELAEDLDNVILGETVNALFPEDSVPVRVLVWNLTEADHTEIQAAKSNVFDLVRLLQAKKLPHALAHPLAPLDGRLARVHVEKCLLLFDVWETRNGGQPRQLNEAAQRIVEQADTSLIDRLANQHGFNLRQYSQLAQIGGSADRVGHTAGRTRTTAPIDGPGQLLDAFAQNQTRVEGEHGRPFEITHSILKNGYLAMREGLGMATDEASFLFDTLGRTDAATQKETGGTPSVDVVQQFAGAPDLVKMVLGHEIKPNEGPIEVLDRFLQRWIPEEINRMMEQNGFDLVALERVLGRSIFGLVPQIGYLMAQWKKSRESQSAQGIEADLYHAGQHPKADGPKVAYVTDTFTEINGVAQTMQRLHRLAADEDWPITFVISEPDRQSEKGLEVFEPAFDFEMPKYPEIQLRLPSLLNFVAWIDDQEFDIIYAVTPGPLGLMAWAAAKLLNKPFVSAFHTDFIRYTSSYSSDPQIEGWIETLLGWFYRQADRVLSPSEAYAARLRSLDVENDKIKVFRRGVDTDRFSPAYRRENFWQQFDPTYAGEKVVLYVGRVAAEKGLNVFADVVDALADRDDIRFAVVGDGPYRETLAERAESKVIFTGYQTGDDLAAAYASADLFCFPSTTETFGNVLLEAQACGLPVLISDEGASRENIIDGTTGVMVVGNDVATYAREIAGILDSPDRWQAMSAAAQELAGSRDVTTLLREMLSLATLDRVPADRPIPPNAGAPSADATRNGSSPNGAAPSSVPGHPTTAGIADS